VLLAGAVIGGAFVAGVAVDGSTELVPPVVVADQADLSDGRRALPASGSTIPLRLPTCSVNPLTENAALGNFFGVVTDPVTGQTLWSRQGETTVTPASVAKVMTAAAALSVLGADTRWATEVRAGVEADSVVLVAGGDPTLSALPEGSEGIYGKGPSLQSLAEQTVASVRATLPEGERVVISNVVVDLSLWDTEDSWDDSWAPSARTNGFMSLVTPLQIDGDRQNPRVELSPRTQNPVKRAVDAYVQALRAAGNTSRSVSVSYGPTDPGSTVLARVESRPIGELVSYMLKESDNTLAEFLARHVSLALGLGGGSDSLQQAIAGSLGGFGLDASSVTIRDGSGLSALNSVSPAYVAGLLTEIYRSQGDLSVVVAGLPIAGVDGSLDNRFSAANASVRERVFAKTGSITGMRSLAGYIEAADTTDLVFAFFAQGDVGDDTRTAIESLVTGVYECGSNLADF
jgi:serine-type D-Ala-D-Ala carboxypeptidase/endopeptidase (penicillin-binding protein 4)